MPESLRTRLERFLLGLIPAYLGTGGRITYVASDWREVRVEVPRSLRTRNYVGTIFGGSMYGAVDPILMIMLIKTLGPGYVVWDKAAVIRFLRPGRSTLRARFELPASELETIRAALRTRRSVDRHYTVRLVDEDGVACAEVEKTLYVRRVDPPETLSPARTSARPARRRRSPGPPDRPRP